MAACSGSDGPELLAGREKQILHIKVRQDLSEGRLLGRCLLPRRGTVWAWARVNPNTNGSERWVRKVLVRSIYALDVTPAGSWGLCEKRAEIIGCTLGSLARVSGEILIGLPKRTAARS